MLLEIPNVSQAPGEPRRRWFTDDDFDVIVWFDGADEILGFQIAYDKREQQKALTWFPKQGFNHNIIDEGEDRPGRYKGTPILVVDGAFNAQAIADSFSAASNKLEQDLVDFIYNTLTLKK
ncbi:MAG: hypothetical protein AAF512_03255 [Pseudomonadota bacterium]